MALVPLSSGAQAIEMNPGLVFLHRFVCAVTQIQLMKKHKRIRIRIVTRDIRGRSDFSGHDQLSFRSCP